MDMDSHHTVLPAMCGLVASASEPARRQLALWWASYEREGAFATLVGTLQQFITIRILTIVDEESMVNHDRLVAPCPPHGLPYARLGLDPPPTRIRLAAKAPSPHLRASLAPSGSIMHFVLCVARAVHPASFVCTLTSPRPPRGPLPGPLRMPRGALPSSTRPTPCAWKATDCPAPPSKTSP